jgi:hypothetical protein
MAMLRALALLPLLRAALAGAVDPSASDPPNVSRFANVSVFTVSGPARGASLRGAQSPNASKVVAVIAHGDTECSGRYDAVQTAAQCEAAALALWPIGLLYPCWHPVWANNLVEVDDADEPQGCLLVTNAGHGCSLWFNAAGRGEACEEPGLSCVVVCGEGDGPVTSTEDPADAATTEAP